MLSPECDDDLSQMNCILLQNCQNFRLSSASCRFVGALIRFSSAFKLFTDVLKHHEVSSGRNNLHTAQKKKNLSALRL